MVFGFFRIRAVRGIHVPKLRVLKIESFPGIWDLGIWNFPVSELK
jgi:hypothetical protein